MKKVDTCFCTDVIHDGHLNILRKAEEYGEVVIGVLCDPEMVRYHGRIGGDSIMKEVQRLGKSS